MKISTLLRHVRCGHFALPWFARDYFWTASQVSNLIKSLYRGYPVGGFIFQPVDSKFRPHSESPHDRNGPVDLIVDGQQRIIAIYNVICAEPDFLRRNARWSLPQLYFHIHDQTFDFYQPSMTEDPFWISLADFFHKGEPDTGKPLEALYETLAGRAQIGEYSLRLNGLAKILNRHLAVEYLPSDASEVEVAEIHLLANGGYRPAVKINQAAAHGTHAI